jgi:hypothetical protein
LGCVASSLPRRWAIIWSSLNQWGFADRFSLFAVR